MLYKIVLEVEGPLQFVEQAVRFALNCFYNRRVIKLEISEIKEGNSGINTRSDAE